MPKERLRGQFEWYKSVPDSGDPETETQGTIFWVGTGTDLRNTEVRGIVEFKNPVEAGVTMDRLRSRVRTEILDELKQAIAPSTPQPLETCVARTGDLSTPPSFAVSPILSLLRGEASARKNNPGP